MQNTAPWYHHQAHLACLMETKKTSLVFLPPPHNTTIGLGSEIFLFLPSNNCNFP